MRPEVADPGAACAVLLEGELGAGEWKGLLAGRHAGDALAVADVLGQILAEHLPHLGLVVPEVMMAGASAHEQVDDSLGFWGMVHPAVRCFGCRCGKGWVRELLFQNVLNCYLSVSDSLQKKLTLSCNCFSRAYVSESIYSYLSKFGLKEGYF